jgi:hypothetical protein
MSEIYHSISVTTMIALYGALLSTIVLCCNVCRDLSDRGRLKIQCYIGNLIQPGSLKDDNYYLVFSVSNIGRDSILVTYVGGKTKKTDFMIIPRDLLKNATTWRISTGIFTRSFYTK